MPIRVDRHSYPEVTEIWGYSPNSIILIMQDGREVKITALRNIKSGALPNYFACYEERVEVKINGRTYVVWTEADYPWQDGETIEECLKLAIRWVIDPH